ncbi:hypothetical protein L7F22_057795 [Adiantum nelumboides]|nr:hypothetical protein [Adiantum nelumboides]
MADRPDDVIEEVSSSQGQQTHEVGESSRPPQTENEIFRTQLVTAVAMFTQVMQNPRFMAFPQPLPPSQSIGNKKSEPAKAQPQRKPLVLGDFVRINFGAVMLPKFSQTGVMLLDTDKRDEEGSSSHGSERVSHDENALFKAQLVSFMETFQQLSRHPKMQELLQASKSPTQTQRASSQSLQSPRQSRSGHMQRKETSKEQRSNDTKGKGHVVEQPPVSIGHRQPSTHGLVNGQDSNEHTMRQTIPLPMSNAGCFGGGSVFQAMIRPSPALHGFMPDNAYGAVPPSGSNPMYGNIGVQPGFQCAAGSYGMPGANMGMAGFAQPDAQNQNMAGRPGMNFGSGMPLLNAPAYDNLTPKGKPKDYKEGGQAVKFDTFHGTHDKLKALLFLQQLDAAFAGGNFTEASMIRKAATFLKTNALQWWTTMLNQGVVPSTWVQFKEIFAPTWITNTFEIDVMTAWNQLSANNCESLEEYNAKFWDALLPVSSFKMVPLAEQIEKYCCGLPKGIKKYCTKTSVMNMAHGYLWCLVDDFRLGVSKSVTKTEGNYQRKPLVLGDFVRINFGAVMLPKFSQTGVMLLDTALSVYWLVLWFHRRDKSLFPQRVHRGLFWVKAHSEHRVFIMADKRDKEGSSSHGSERVSHDENALFKAQLVSFMETFQQLSRHPKMQELLQASKSPTQTQRASSQSLQSPRQSRSGHMQRKETSKEQRSNDTKGKGHVVEQPPVSIGHRQPSTHGLVNGQDSNEHTMRQTIPLPMSNAGCFGDAQNQNMAGRPGMNFGSGMPLLNAPAYDNLTPKGKPKDYKEGGQAVKFDTFHGTHDKLKAVLFLQQFDAAFAGGNFTEASKIRKAATFLKTNALQWWTTMLNQVSSFKMVPLAEQIEKYCCGLPKGIKKYCTKTSVMNMAQLMENAEVADDLIQGKPDEDGFKTRRKEHGISLEF